MRGESEVGKKLEFWFYGKYLKEMIVTALKVDELVRCVSLSDDPDWV